MQVELQTASTQRKEKYRIEHTLKMDSKEFWNSRAEYYKDYNEVTTLPPTLTLANMLEIYDAEDIVEVACASGVFTTFYLCNLERAKTFISVDISDVMVKLAEERKANAKGVNKKINHEFKVGTALDLNFIKDESMDMYISNMCVHIVSEKAKFLKEARRVLKRGGKIGLTVPCREDGMMNLFMDNVEKIAPTAGPFPWHLFSLGYKDKMVALLQENEFQVRYCWDDHIKIPYYDDECIDAQFKDGEGKKFFASLTPDQIKKVKKMSSTIFMR